MIAPVFAQPADRGDIAPDAHIAGAAVQWRLVAALTAVAMLALLDKYALSLLVQPLKSDLHLSDTQVGLAVGAAFAIANIAIGIPAGWMADIFDRRRIIFAGILLWSAMAALCGLTTNFWSFFWARAGVGLGEGLIPPASYALIRDGVSPARQGRAFGIFAMSNTLGPGFALLLGGSLIAAIASMGWSELPVIGTIHPWQLTLLLLGIAGLPLSMLAFAFPDPARHQAKGASVSLVAAFAAMRDNREIYLPLILFSCASAMVASAIGIWLPAYIGRTFGLTPPQIGLRLGLLLSTAGPIGLMTTGIVIDRLRLKGRDGAPAVAIIVAVVLGISSTCLPLFASQSGMWIAETGVLLSSTCYLALVSIIVSRIAEPATVGKIMATILVIQGIFGSGLSPIMVGFLADHVFGGAGGLGLALSTFTGTVMVFGVGGAWTLHARMHRRSLSMRESVG